MTDKDPPLGSKPDGELNVVEEGSPRQEPLIVDKNGKEVDPFLLDDDDTDDDDNDDDNNEEE